MQNRFRFTGPVELHEKPGPGQIAPGFAPGIIDPVAAKIVGGKGPGRIPGQSAGMGQFQAGFGLRSRIKAGQDDCALKQFRRLGVILKLQMQPGGPQRQSGLRGDIPGVFENSGFQKQRGLARRDADILADIGQSQPGFKPGRTLGKMFEIDLVVVLGVAVATIKKGLSGRIEKILLGRPDRPVTGGLENEKKDQAACQEGF